MHYFEKNGLGILKEYAIIFVLLMIVLFFWSFSSAFFSLDNFMNVLVQNAYLVIAAMGETIVMISGGIDLSIGYQISIVSIIIIILMKLAVLSLPVTIICGLVAGLLLGMINGYLIMKINVHPIITTLGTMTVLQGISFVILQSETKYTVPAALKLIGEKCIFSLPLSLFIALFIVLISSFILNKTYIGKYVYVIGESIEVGRLAGINANAMKIFAFSICGFFNAVSAFVLLARTGALSPSMTDGTGFTVITAAALGGVSLRGGEGKIWKVIVGVFVLAILANGMQFIGLGIYPQHIAKGIILLVAIAMDSTQKRKDEV
jgi:ribose transport system permease protein